METRDFWERRSSFVLAAIGSAIGLGNVWRFPYIAQKGGGGAFLIPYFVALLTAGIPLLILEMGLGQYMQNAAPTAFAKIRKKLEWFGWFAVCLSAGIVIYYSTILAWSWNYLYHSLNLSWSGDTERFFVEEVLHRSSGPGELGGMQWPLVIGMALTWVLIYWILRKGVSRVGKVVLVTVPVPWICLVILFIRGITLPNAIEGLAFYLTPDFSKIFDPEIWLLAYGQIFFSLSLGSGVMIAYGSYLTKKPEITNNAFITALANCGTSFFAGFAVFSTLGYLAFMTGVPVEQVSASGSGLAYMTYPTAISKLPAMNSFFAIVFFIMLVTLGIDSAFALQEAFTSGIIDKWRLSKSKVNLIFCVVAFLICLLFTTQAGYFWQDIADHYIADFGLVVTGLFQCIIIGYVLGTRDFRRYLNSISEIRLGIWWDVMIKYFTPVVLVIILTINIYKEIKQPYGNFPRWSLLVGGWGVLLVCILLGFYLYAKKGVEEER
ncbi:sodium-dependent transporter [candidate division CSSED10-310 bacterium]|uniref:Sodium-dependent transporter n=1 Tax=candidate division CSSED10-310 bacterium TaxID=2855610 RepID=A0ABV6YW90_UNCC1